MIPAELREALTKILAYEEYKEQEYRRKNLPTDVWWTWQDVAVDWPIIKKLLLAGYLEVIGGRHKYYRLKNREEIKKLLAEPEEPQKPSNEPLTLPPDLFDVIEGYDDLKKFIKLSLTAPDPVHILLVGPPGTAKSLFLSEIERLGGYYVTMGTASKVGLRDVIFEETPRILVIDEIDKLNNRKDIASLLTWMESGRIIITVSGRKEQKTGKGWVFGACNTTKGLPPELLDRFQVFHLKPYSPEQYKRVVTNYLTKRLGKPEELASYIAEKVSTYTDSVREAIRVARLANTKKDVDMIVGIITKYHPSSRR